ncbi:MAG: CRTAC1 family protein, partial [Phaeodactylibacter sp.]|nr:CRTAC1 family protein [Phaeodactylibacter sp.]
PAKSTWNTGISMVDVNGDGHLDIYLCRSGNLKLANRMNLLFINKGDGTFKERAASFGLNDPGYSIQANFFDYDKDGDLDMYLANHGINFYGRDPQGQSSGERDQYSGDKLYRNDEGRFTNVTQEAGILERAYSYGLGVSIGDLNQDGWDDIYVSNDFFEPDYLYWNQGDGTFKEGVKDATRQISYFGMGNTLADLNNDQLLDIMVVDMTAEDHYRRHANLAGLSYEKFWDFVDKGYHFQYMFNSLNMNNGNGTFSNQAQLAGIAQTDWSWAPLAADFNNDGRTDLYITNGLRKDVLNLDFINNIDKKFAKYIGANGQLPEDRFVEMLQTMPAEKVGNFFYRNDGDLQFTDVRDTWGADTPSFSTGGAYADLDQDGDLDLVINNIDAPAFVFENKQDASDFIRIALQGDKKNRFGWGAKVTVSAAGQAQFQQQYPIRGYQSSVDPVLHFGLPASGPVEVQVEWADGSVSILENVTPNQVLKVSQSEADGQLEPSPKVIALFEKATALGQRHTENDFIDFKREFLLPHKMSALGPVLAVGDVNQDGLDDYFL